MSFYESEIKRNVFVTGLGDGKIFIRSASISAINAFGNQCGYKDLFEGEMIADALKTGSPTLKIELWLWLSEKLPNSKLYLLHKVVIFVLIFFVWILIKFSP